MNQYEEGIGFAQDIPDPRDYQSDELFGTASAQLPNYFRIDLAPSLDQGSTMYCTAFSACNTINEQTAKEQSTAGVPYSQRRTGYDLSEIGLKAGKLSKTEGGAINWVLPYMRTLGDITGWVTVGRSIDAIKNSLFTKGCLLTGSNQISWGALSKTNFIVEKASPGSAGHAFCLSGWDDNKQVFYVKNSWGEAWGDFGDFEIPYSLALSVLFTIYAVTDADDLPSLRWMKATKAGYVNWADKDRAITRLELAIVLGRMLGFLENTANFTNVPLAIWNEQRPNDPASETELKTMVARAGFIGKIFKSTSRIDVISSLLS